MLMQHIVKRIKDALSTLPDEPARPPVELSELDEGEGAGAPAASSLPLPTEAGAAAADRGGRRHCRYSRAAAS